MLIRNDFFNAGFGDYGHLDAILALKRVLPADVPPDHPVRVDRVERLRSRAYAVVHGDLESPLEVRCPGLLPPECRRARFQLVVADADADAFDPAHGAPRPAFARPQPRSVCLQFAATGDHSFWRRRVLSARPLLREHGIASLLLENPLYGARKPAAQRRSNLRHVFDLYLMGIAIQYEAVALVRWLEGLHWGPFGFAGTAPHRTAPPLPPSGPNVTRHTDPTVTVTSVAARSRRLEHGRSHGVPGGGCMAWAARARLVPGPVLRRRSVRPPPRAPQREPGLTRRAACCCRWQACSPRASSASRATGRCCGRSLPNAFRTIPRPCR